MAGRTPGLHWQVRFWEKVNKNGPAVTPELGPCWLWTGCFNRYDRQGYGHFRFDPDGGRNYQSLYSHRLAWEMEYGTIPAGLEVAHKCDVANCVRASHLYLATHAQNVKDMWAKGRGRTRERHYRAKLTMDKAREIRKMGQTTNMKQREIGAAFGISQSTVWAIISNQSWKEDV